MKRNAGNVGNAVFTYMPVDGDVVTCEFISSEACPVGNPAASNAITMTVNSSLPAGVSVSASANPFCAGSGVTFTAVPVNGGGAPGYQWIVNGVVAAGLLNTVGSRDTDGFNANPTFTYLPQAGDSVWCVMTSNLRCVTMNPASSNKIVMVAAIKPAVSFVACNDVITTVNAQPFKLKGGTPLGGAYSGPGVNSVTGIFTPSVAGTGIKTIKYSYTNVATCSDEKSITITVLPAPNFKCGDVLTDVRDGKQYKTFVLPNGRCWMAENLEYGMTIDEFVPQTDNCLAERYVRPSSFVHRPSFLPHPPGPLLLEEKGEEPLPSLFPGYLVEGWGSGSVLNSNFDCSTVRLFKEKSEISNVKSEIRNGALYQWDELMQYQTTPGTQGLCPPAWHVPTSSEWDELLVFYNGPGEAGWPMKDTLLATGFHSVQTGFIYQNNLWSFISGATAGTMYWTSTPSGAERAVARGVNEYNPSVSKYTSLRSNGFGVRCCRD